jgi:hypothetical protein
VPVLHWVVQQTTISLMLRVVEKPDLIKSSPGWMVGLMAMFASRGRFIVLDNVVMKAHCP